MEKRDSRNKLKKMVETLLLELHTDRIQNINEMCRDDVIWKVENCNDGKIKALSYHNLQMKKISEECYLLTCEYMINAEEDKKQFELITVIAKERFVYVHTSNLKRSDNYKVVTPDESIYLLKENEILYIESQHNHIVWHCAGEVIVNKNSLTNVQEFLSEEFVRIHRCYIVNKLHIRVIRRCEVQLSNGDILPIPSKKFAKIKKKLVGENKS